MLAIDRFDNFTNRGAVATPQHFENGQFSFGNGRRLARHDSSRRSRVRNALSRLDGHLLGITPAY